MAWRGRVGQAGHGIAEISAGFGKLSVGWCWEGGGVMVFGMGHGVRRFWFWNCPTEWMDCFQKGCLLQHKP